MATNLNERFRNLLTTATLLDACTDDEEYDRLYNEYLSLQQDIDSYDNCFDEEDDIVEPQWEELIYSENGKYGIRATSWTPAVPASFDGIESVECSNRYRVERGGKVGMIWLDENVHEYFKVEYDFITEFAQDQYILVKNKEQYYSRGGLISPTHFDEICVPVCAGWIHVKKNGTWGYLDGNLEFCSSESDAHEFVIPYNRIGVECTFEEQQGWRPVTRQDIMECDAVEQELKKVGADQDEWTAYQRRAQVLLPNHECKTIEHENRYGVADFLDSNIIPPIYDEIVITEHAVPAIYGKQNGLWAILYPNDYNPFFVSEELPKAFLCENWIIAKLNGKYGIYNSHNGAWLLEPIYDEFLIKENHRCIITKLGNQYGFFNDEFNILPAYDAILLGSFYSFIRVLKNGITGYIDETGSWTNDIAQARVYTRNL